MAILWCITGAGHLLQEVCNSIREFSRKNKITVAFSNAGYEVSQMYGFFEKISESAVEVILEKDQGYSSHVCGRFVNGEYKMVVIAPCTSNTVAKIAHGISDSLVSNIAAQALKGRIPVIVLPTDIEKIARSKSPIIINIEKCKNCKPCPAMENCPNSAFFVSDRIRINPLRCNACKKCIEFCKYDAIEFGREIEIHARKIDMENVKKLEKMENIIVVKNLEELEKKLQI